MRLDIEKYRKYVEGFDLTEEQKTELIKSVWTIMESFVDRAFGLHPAQQCREYSQRDTLHARRKAPESKKYRARHSFEIKIVPDDKERIH